MDPKKIQKDLDKLEDKAKEIKRYANNRIAHPDKKGPKTIPTFKNGIS